MVTRTPAAQSFGGVGLLSTIRTSNTPAQNDAAIASDLAASLASGVPLLLPAGVFDFSAPINARGDRIAMSGAGMFSTRLRQTSSNTPLLQVGGQFQRYDGFSLEYAAQQPSTATNANCVEFFTSYFSSFSNIYTYGGARHWYIPQVNPGPGQNGAFSNVFTNIRGLGATLAWINFTGYIGFWTGSVWSNCYFNNKVGGTVLACAGAVVEFANGDELVINQMNLEDIDMGAAGGADKVMLIGNRATVINGLHFERVKMARYDGTLMVVSTLAKLSAHSVSVAYSEVLGTGNGNRSIFKVYNGRLECSGLNVHNVLKESGAAAYVVDVNSASNRAKAVVTMADYDAAGSTVSTSGTATPAGGWTTGPFFNGNAVNDTTSVVSVS